MKARHSQSLLLIWQIAALEAKHLHAATIEPAHFLLALCKSVDLDLPALVSNESPERDEVLEELLREVRRLRTIFRAAGLDARKFRRALRRARARQREPELDDTPERMHRSEAAKRAFTDAGHLAEMDKGIVFPAHLLFAVMSIEDPGRDELLDQHGVEAARLKSEAKREILSFLKREEPPVGNN